MLYFIMCLTIAAATYEFINQILTDALDSGAHNIFVDNRVAVLFGASLVSMILAPVAVVVLLFPKIKTRVAEYITLAFNAED